MERIQQQASKHQVRHYRNPMGLAVRFSPEGDDGGQALYEIPKSCEGYPGVAHGGALATLLDEAMAYCLFRKDIYALTGHFEMRFKRPVPIEKEVAIHAKTTKARPPLYELKAIIEIDGLAAVSAQARFFEPDSGIAGVTH